jgi:uncharacterized membrane protein YeiH
MKALLITAAFIGAYLVVDNLPTELAMVVGISALVGFFASAIALAVKWVRNV